MSGVPIPWVATGTRTVVFRPPPTPAELIEKANELLDTAATDAARAEVPLSQAIALEVAAQLND